MLVKLQDNCIMVALEGNVNLKCLQAFSNSVVSPFKSSLNIFVFEFQENFEFEQK